MQVHPIASNLSLLYEEMAWVSLPRTLSAPELKRLDEKVLLSLWAPDEAAEDEEWCE